MGSEHSVSVVRDLSYLSGDAPTPSKGRLDLYLPRGSTGFPVIVSIHGGALMQGDKSSEEFVGRRFAGAGIGTAVINYRLSPEVSHPTPCSGRGGSLRLGEAFSSANSELERITSSSSVTPRVRT